MGNKEALIKSIILVQIFILLFIFLWFLGNIGRFGHQDTVNKQGEDLVRKMALCKVSDADKAIRDASYHMNENAIKRTEDDSFDLKGAIEVWSRQLKNNAVPVVTQEELAEFQKFFSNTVFFGDSMAQEISEYKLVDSSNVVYKRSAYIKLLKNKITQVIEMYPGRIVMFTGLNDCSYYYHNIDGFVTDYKSMIRDIKKELPDTEVVVCSVLPPNNTLTACRGDLANSDDFDAALIQLCEEEGWIYIDTKWMVFQSLYLDDGIHFDSSFYAVYMRYLYLVLNRVSSV